MSNSSFNTRIGPIHPALKEPIQFMFQIEGEKVVKADFAPGHAHRGIEWAAWNKNALQIIYMAERACGICGISHSLAFCHAIEQIAEIEVPPRADFIRTIWGELERLHSHLLWAGVAALELGFDSLFFKSWDVREKVMDLIEQVSGNRVNYGIMTVGGVRRDILPEHVPAIVECLEYYEGLYATLAELFLEDKVIKMRCQGTGILTKRDALELCTVGPQTRASGVNADCRQDFAYCAYGDLDIKAQTPDMLTGEVNGDVYDRIVVRLLEVAQSIDIIRQCVAKMPEGEINSIAKPMVMLNKVKKAGGEGIGRHEAPRGEDFHYVRKTEGEESPDVWKVKASTYSNMMSWLTMLEGEQVADIPIIVASIDPCMSCTDRVAIVKQGRTSMLTKEDLRKLSVEKTRSLQK